MKSSRLPWADIAKGVAILLVVVNHTGGGVIGANIGSTPAGWADFTAVCYAFMVPVFFLLSGWFSQLSSKTPGERIKALASNLVYPYILWSLLQTALMIVTKAGNTVPTWGDMPAILLNGYMQFWFLHCLIMILLSDLLLRYFRIPVTIRLCGALGVASAAVCGLQLPRVLEEFATHILYFEVGVFLAVVSSTTRLPVNRMGLAFAGALMLLTFHFNGAGYQTPLRPLGAFAGILFCLSTASLLACSRNVLSTLLGMCGRYSLQIYVSHLIFSAGLRVLLSRSGVDLFWVHVLAGSLVGIVLPVMLVHLGGNPIQILFRFPHPGPHH